MGASPAGPGGYGAMVGGGPPGMGPMGQAGPMGAMGQLQSVAIKMGMEIDMQLKQLAQMMPLMQAWAERVGEELKVQLAQSLQQGAAPTVPATGMSQFPDGTGRL